MIIGYSSQEWDIFGMGACPALTLNVAHYKIAGPLGLRTNDPPAEYKFEHVRALVGTPVGDQVTIKYCNGVVKAETCPAPA